MKGGTLPTGFGSKDSSKEFITSSMPTHGTLPAGMKPAPKRVTLPSVFRLPPTGTTIRERILGYQSRSQEGYSSIEEYFPGGQRVCEECGEECYWTSEKRKHVDSHVKYKHITIPITRRQIGHCVYLVTLFSSIFGIISGTAPGIIFGVVGVMVGTLVYVLMRVISGDDMNPFHLINREIKLKK